MNIYLYLYLYLYLCRSWLANLCESFSQTRCANRKFYLERPCWPLAVPSGSQMRSWFPAFGYWLQTPLPLGSGRRRTCTKHTQWSHSKPCVYGVCWSLLHLFVGSVIVARVGASFPCVQRRHPVGSFKLRDSTTLKRCGRDRKTNQDTRFRSN